MKSIKQILAALGNSTNNTDIFTAAKDIVSRIDQNAGCALLNIQCDSLDRELQIIKNGFKELPALEINGQDLLDEFNELIDRLDGWVQSNELAITL